MPDLQTPESTPAAPPQTPEAPQQTPLEQSSQPTIPERKEPAHPYDDDKIDKPSRRFEGMRAKKDAAKPSDVPEIKDLSTLIKSLKPASEADAPRIQALKKQLREALEIPDAPAPTPEPTLQPTYQAPQIPASFTEQEPKLDDFIGKSDDPYLAHARALAAYDRRKDAALEAEQRYQQQAQQIQQQAAAQWQQVQAQFAARIGKFQQERPADFQKLTSSPKLQRMSAVMDVAVKLSPTAEEDLLHWMDDPFMLDALYLETATAPVREDIVAYVQRRLSSRVPAGTTGAAPTRPLQVAPKPPTPVRTGPMTTPAESSDEDDSLEAHAKQFGRGRRR